MERKIGEIFEYNGEWYQCLKGTSCKECDFSTNNVTCNIHGEITCTRKGRSDDTSVVFKKLEKVGEPFACRNMSLGHYGIIVQRYKVFVEPILTDDSIRWCNSINQTILIPFNSKENMEEKKLNLKPFDIQKAKQGKPVCTRDGRKARIICFDRKSHYPIIALVETFVKEYNSVREDSYYYTINGRAINIENESKDDLMMLPEKRNGWVNVYNSLGVITFSHNPYDTKEEALASEMESPVLDKYYVDTVKIEWEE